MPDDVTRKFTSFQPVKEPEPTSAPIPTAAEEYERRVREIKAQMQNQPGWRGRELRRRLNNWC